MPAFTLYGATGSSCTDRVRLTLAEGGFTDYEFVPLQLFKGEQKSEKYTKLHPWGKVPAVVFQDGFTLYESRAICKHLARKYAFPLLPSSSDMEYTALFEQAELSEMAYFADPMGRLSFQKLIKPKITGMPPDEGVVAEALKALEEFFNVAERVLLKNGYMAGSRFTLVDLYYIPLIQRLFTCGHGDLVTSREVVNDWWTRCSERPAVQSIVSAGTRT